MPTIISVLTRKGGAGKTTIATNLARSLQLRGLQVALCDLDEQGSARDWAAVGARAPVTVGVDRPSLVETKVPQLNGFDVCVLDGAAKVTQMTAAAIKVSDLVLIPVQPSALDVWTVGEIVEAVETRRELTGRPQSAFVTSRAITGTRLAEEVQEALAEFDGVPLLKATIFQRVAYAKAAGRGQSVIDLDPESKAAREIQQLTDEVLQLLPIHV